MKVYLIAGESSGDYLGSELMFGLRKLYSDIQFFGVGGPLMVESGLSSLFPMDEFCLLYTSPSPRDKRQSRMPSSA